MPSTAPVIAIAGLMVAAAAGIGYYQFVYVPQAGTLPPYVDDVAEVKIVEGASLQSSPQFMDPEVVTVVIGVNSTVRWTNHDTVPHTVVSDTGYTDPATGRLFDSSPRREDGAPPFILPGESFEFTFSEPGMYGYHHEPHPWIKGTVIVLDNKE